MSKNVIRIPENLYREDLPQAYSCEIHIGQMSGQLGTQEGMIKGSYLPAFEFEMYDAEDPTIWILKFPALGAVAEELARWEHHGDLVGLVIESRPRHIALLLAFNFTRGRWISTDYYPHLKDWGPWSRMDVFSYRTVMLSLTLPVLIAAIVGFQNGGLILLPVWLYFYSRTFKQHKTINSSPCRMETARKIAAWIEEHCGELAGSWSPDFQQGF